MRNSPRLNIVGGGRVGRTLAHLWRKSGSFAVQDVLCTTLESARSATRFIEAGNAVEDIAGMSPAEVWMLSVPDTQIANVALQLADRTAGRPPGVAFHCSGALASDLLEPLQAQGWQVASAHCLLSFASTSASVQQFSGTPCALEGAPHACTLLQEKFSTIGARCFEMHAQDKRLYHAGAVFATNFLPVLQSIAEDLWRDTGMPADVRLQLRQSLLEKVVSNINALGPQGALTGPAARGDTDAIALQAKAVTQWNVEAGAAYKALSALALELARQH